MGKSLRRAGLIVVLSEAKNLSVENKIQERFFVAALLGMTGLDNFSAN
jgi:hypothetical protein